MREQICLLCDSYTLVMSDTRSCDTMCARLGSKIHVGSPACRLFRLAADEPRLRDPVPAAAFSAKRRLL